MKKEKYLPIIKNGRIYINDLEVNDLSIFIDGDVLVRWGSFEKVSDYFKRYVSILDSKDCLLVNLNTLGISKEDTCYIVTRLIEYTATGFASTLREKVNSKDFKEWLKTEKERFPLKG